MMLTRKVLAAGALAAFVAFPVSAVLAQSSGSMTDSGSSASSPAQSGQVDDATLQKAAKAYVKVKQIVHQTKQTASAYNGTQPDRAAAESEELAAVRNEGLNPQQYNHIIRLVQNDPGLQQKFASYVNQNGGDPD
jgi:Domain of unknown function (DUF4168)